MISKSDSDTNLSTLKWSVCNRSGAFVTPSFSTNWSSTTFCLAEATSRSTAKKSEDPTPTGTSLQGQTYRDNYPCKESPVKKNLQADKPLFPLPLAHAIPPEGCRGAGGGAGMPKKEKKRLLSGSPVYLYQLFHDLLYYFPLFFFWHEET